MNDRPIHYEPHPVSRERKAELKALGFNIIDIKFAPPATKQPKPKARKSQSEPQGVS